ncbi:MAG: hypothetical protein QOI10_1803 [Solirubrobacterales bacterium]|jgi:hypothetical protein|nr:hypothetical protein [Solirubrobacterales bacterium]
MTAAPLTRARERLDSTPAEPPEIDPAPVLGAWVVFEPGTTGITRVEVEGEPGSLQARVFGSALDGQPDWGLTAVEVFADDVAGGEAWAFRASYDHGWQRVELFGYLNRGVLAVDAGTVFAEGSGRSDYFTRELFYRL